MFTQACFIRKNTYELVEKLKELGYIPGFSARNNYGNSLQSARRLAFGLAMFGFMLIKYRLMYSQVLGHSQHLRN